ncbi:hypothetical protein P3G55_15790 [Leptospira sp. 96542]|nr:hypothetical protein [Leptospira sp. 96542]
MKFVSAIPILFWIVLLSFGNYLLFSNTEKKISHYNENPPFRLEDTTRSGGIHHLLDKNPTTVWKKIGQRTEEFDFFLELHLTHYWDGEIYQPRLFTDLVVEACPDSYLPKFQTKILLRESINVDKELRMPKDKLAIEFNFNENFKKQVMIPLTNLPKFKKESNYPNGIFILTAEFISDSPYVCFSEVKLVEKKDEPKSK